MSSDNCTIIKGLCRGLEVPIPDDAIVTLEHPNVLKDDDNKLQKNAVVLYGIWKGDVTRFSGSQEVMCLDKRERVK